MKMSKSLGNTINPLDLMKEYGADILRLWALSRRLHRGPPDRQGNPRRRRRPVSQAPQHIPLSARRARRIQRGGGLETAAMPELERYMLHLAAELDATLAQAVEDFDFNTYVRALTDFCNEDLSAFYFDIRKDVPLLRVNAVTGPRPKRAAPIGPCSTPCSTRWSAGCARCWCSPPRKCGARAFPMRARCICSSGRKFAAGRGRRGRMGLVACASRRSHRSDRAAAPRQGARIEPRGRSLTVPSDDDPALLAELFITSTVHKGDWR